MPRTYTPNREKKYKKYDAILIEQALKEYNSTNMSLKYISQKYNVSKSVLHRHNNVSVKKQGGQTALTENEEGHLILHINNWYKEWGHPLKITDLRLFIKSYLDYLGVVIKRFKDNMPGPDYIQYFLKRNRSKITRRSSQNTKDSRAALSSEVINSYFDKLKISPQGIEDINLNSINSSISEKSGPRKIIKIKKKFTKIPQKVSIDQKEKNDTRSNEYGKAMDNEKNLSEPSNIQPVQVKKTDNSIYVNKTKIKVIKIIKMNKYNNVDIGNNRTPIMLLTKPIFSKPFAPPPNPQQQIDNYVEQNNITIDSNQTTSNQNIATMPVVFDNILTVQQEVKLSSLTTKEEEKIEVQANKENIVKKRAIIIKPIYLNKNIKVISVKKVAN
nr:uncharacterized protein LOC116766760 [Danaus plexippus plexippus]